MRSVIICTGLLLIMWAIGYKIILFIGGSSISEINLIKTKKGGNFFEKIILSSIKNRKYIGAFGFVLLLIPIISGI